jgi:hypothetical protein
MKSVVCAAITLVVLSACASSSQSSGPNVTLHLTPVSSPADIFYFAGPINLQYQLSVINPTSEPLTLTRLELRTIGPGAYSIRTQASPMNLKIPPNATVTYTISVWGYARGGYLAAEEPVTLQGTTFFRGTSSGSFIRIFNETISPH